MNREFRKDVKLDGIPIFWYTNLCDEEVRELYVLLKREDDDPFDWEIKVEGFPPKISVPPLYTRNIMFKDGWCECYGWQFSFHAIYRSAQDWELWEAHQREIEEFKEERSNQLNTNRLLFEMEDDPIAEGIKSLVEQREFEAAANLIEKRLLIAARAEEHNRALGFRHFYVVGKVRDDAFQTFLCFPTTEYAVRFLRKHRKSWWSYTFFGRKYYESNGGRGKAPIQEVDRVFRAAIHDFPQEGKLHKSICLFWNRENQIKLAIEYCQIAFDGGLRDDTQNGFAFRLKRLLRKSGQTHA